MLDTDLVGFIDPEYGGWSPFEIVGGNLVIKLRKAADVGVSLNNQYTATPLDWVSGFLSAKHRLAQTYGVFEARLKMPGGIPILPAFWLLASDGEWPPEIYHEYLPGSVAVRLGVATAGPTRIDVDVPVVGFTDDFHDWRVVWRSDSVRLYLDDALVSTQGMTGRPISEPMYPVLSIGLSGVPDGDTPDADMIVEHLRVFA